MSTSRRTSLAVTIAGVALLSAACGRSGPTPTPAPPTAITSPATSASFSPTTTAAQETPLVGPVKAADLGTGWKDGPPTSGTLHGDWLRVCGQGTGISGHQLTQRTQELTAPGGVEVFTRIATYRPGGAAAAVDSARTTFTSCPLEKVAGGRQVTSLTSEDIEDGAAGALISKLDNNSHQVDGYGYWIVAIGNQTVEVYARGLFAVTSALDPMTTFVTALRDAAVTKAHAGKVAPVKVPLLQSQADTLENEGFDPDTSGSGIAPNVDAPDPDQPAPIRPGTGGEAGPGSVSND